MSNHDELNKKRGSLATKRMETAHRPHHRLSSFHLPDRLRYGDDDQEDLTAPPRDTEGREARIPYGVFSFLAAAGSRSEFYPRIDAASDSEVEDAERRPGPRLLERECGQTREANEKSDEANQRGRARLRRRSDNRVPKKPVRSQSRSRSRPLHQDQTTISGTDPLLPLVSAALNTSRPGSQARLESPARPQPPAGESKATSRTRSGSASLLSTRLKDVFDLEKPEKVLAEYQCWLLQSILLQGYMYVLERHICFYAYLPSKSHSVIKSGYLSKRGKQNPKYKRYWFSLKGYVLSYYLDPSNLYFPSGHVDLRHAISANLVENKDKDRTKDFMVTTDDRTYQFRADSAPSAREWVKALQKVIFRSHNVGDSVKILIPIENAIDIEENPMMDFAETCKIRVLESGDSYAIDEYFFSFFDDGKEAVRLLKTLVNDTPAQQIAQERLSLSPQMDNGLRIFSRNRAHSTGAASSDYGSVDASQLLQSSVRATLRPPSRQRSGSRGSRSPRHSAEVPRDTDEGTRREQSRHSRTSSDVPPKDNAGQSEADKSGAENRGPERVLSSSDSFVHSIEQATESSALLQSTTTESASQILNRSDVFISPTMDQLQRMTSQSIAEGHHQSQDTARSAPPAEVRIQPPSRTQTIEASVENRSSETREALSESEQDHDATTSRRNFPCPSSSPSLQDLVKAGTYPLQRAAGFAGYLKDRSKRMSSLLASESMGYFEKVSGMWSGTRKHYGEAEGVISSIDPEDEEQCCDHGDRFRAHFALPPSEKLQATYFGYLHRVLPLYGKLYISNRKFCFRSFIPGTRTKMILPLKDIENVEKEKGFRFGYSGLVVVIRGHEELFFEFSSAEARDDCAVTLHRGLESIKYLVESGLIAQQEKEEAEAARAEHLMLQEARLEGGEGQDRDLQSMSDSAQLSSDDNSPILFDDPRASIVSFKPSESLRITCLTIGSRGDVQPYIALCKGLLAEGHKPKIATHREFEPWIRKHGIDFAPVEGDPAELMRICVENGMFTYSFLREASAKFRGWIDDLLTSAWKSCQESDILIESPSAMAGIHIAEALGIPYFRAFTMPWTRTRAYPHAFAVPEHKMGGAYNYISYVMFDNVFWKAIAGQVNRWRKKELGLRSTNLDRMQPNKVPFLYNFSPSVVPPPLDYSDWIRVTGYWFLDEASDWQPPEELTAFIKKAREDGKKLVYIGFGSIVVSDPTALTKTVVESVLKADVRCVLSKGWSDRLGDPSSTKTEIPLPPELHQIQAAPHDWLFSQMDAVAHHGGAGTTGASLRAGVPTIVKPFFGDQFFFGGRVEDLGVGICMKKLNVSIFSKALWEATHSERMIVKARKLGEQIRKEDGVGNAIQALYRDLEYAKTLVKQRSASRDEPAKAAHDTGTEGDIAIEEWTIIP
ncbi:hypothetical protein VTO42DRAFT_961 [Malbranchea cinnamomea]